jgi:hypothetical protein
MFYCSILRIVVDFIFFFGIIKSDEGHCVSDASVDWKYE